jgi:hypothetical protein
MRSMTERVLASLFAFGGAAVGLVLLRVAYLEWKGRLK